MPIPMTFPESVAHLTMDNAHLTFNHAILTANKAAQLAIKEFSFDRDLNKLLIHHVNAFIETGEESNLTLVNLYLVKLRSEREEEQMKEEEREIDRLREEKVRSDAEEDRHYLFLRESHSREALH
jgi:hypothetical protein